jgi:hypothetical protein
MPTMGRWSVATFQNILTFPLLMDDCDGNGSVGNGINNGQKARSDRQSGIQRILFIIIDFNYVALSFECNT